MAAGAWQPVGPSNGVLPTISNYTSSCLATPALVVDAADRPIVAYGASNKVFVQRLESGAWATLGSDAAIYSTFDLKLDAADTPWFVHANTGTSGSGGTTVRRYDGVARAFVDVGPNGGRLPETTTARLSAPRLLFSADGRPTIAAYANVGTGGVTYPGLATYRYDGSIWSTSGAYQTGPGSLIADNTEPGFAIAGNEALLAWSNVNQGVAALIVQRTSASGDAPVGPGLGELAQYTRHGITPDATASDPRLLATGGEVYLARTIRTDPHPTSAAFKVMLLRAVLP